MTKDEIIAMSKEFWLTDVGAESLSKGWDVEITIEDLEKIIHLVAEQEREKCARVCEKTSSDMNPMAHWAANECARLIRGMETQ